MIEQNSPEIDWQGVADTLNEFIEKHNVDRHDKGYIAFEFRDSGNKVHRCDLFKPVFGKRLHDLHAYFGHDAFKDMIAGIFASVMEAEQQTKR